MNRKRFALTLIVVTLLTLTVAVANCGSVNYPHRGDTSLPTTASDQTPTPTGLVFSDGFERGWGAWTYDSPVRDQETGGHVTSGPWAILGATYALDSTVVHSGNIAAKFTLPEVMGSWSNVYKTVDYATTLYMSGWFMFDASIPNGSYLLVGPCICGYGDHDLVCGYIYNSNGVLKWSTEYYTNAAGDTLFATSSLGPSIQTKVWYNVQVMSKVGNGNGEVAMWVMQQGQSQFTEIARMTGLTNDGDKGPNGEIGARHLQVGPYVPSSWVGPSQQAFPVKAWYDDTLASTSALGPVSKITTTTITASTTAPAVGQSVTFTATLKSGTTALSGKSVSIYHYFNGVKYTDTTKTTNSAGQISLTQSFGSTGQRTYYATFAGDTGYKTSTSPAVTINVQ